MNEDLANWDYCRTFLSVMSEGSLSAAARALGLTQPTVGRHIDALERSVGGALFIRSQRGLLPTDAALRMKPYAQAMAATAAALMRSGAASASLPQGRVRISCSEVMGVEVLPPMLAALQARHPGLVLELSLSDAIEDLLNQEADIAIRMVAPAQDALVSRHVGAVPLGFFAHRDYLARYGTPRSLDELEHHRLIGFDRHLAYVREALRTRPDMASLDFGFRTDSNLAQLAMIRAAGGVGMCQVALGRADADLVELPGALALKLDTYVVMHENVKTTPRCRVAFDALVEGLIAYCGATVGARAPETGKGRPKKGLPSG